METQNSRGVISEQDALGQRGILIRSFDGRFYFRQYDAAWNFVDYEITNHDIDIVIADLDAALIRTEHGDFLDYTSRSMQHANPESDNDLDKKTD